MIEKGMALTEINQDLIRDLRQSGKHEEANSLLQAYYKSKEKAKEQTKREIRAKDHVIKKHIQQLEDN